MADRKVRHLFKFETICDILATLPSFFLYAQTQVALVNVMRILRAVRILKVFRLFRPNYNAEEEGSNVFDNDLIKQQMAKLVLTLFSVLFIAAGFVFYCDTAYNNFNGGAQDGETAMDYFTAFYYIVVTSFTVGYGDITPGDNISRLLVIIIIMTMIVLVTDQTSKMNNLLARSSKYDRYLKVSDHVILTGAINSYTMARFLQEFYHPDHGKQTRRLVAVCDVEPSDGIVALLADTAYEGKVFYLKGSLQRSNTASKCQLLKAHAVFILSDCNAVDPNLSDAIVMLTTRAVEEHVGNIKTLVQLNRPENLLHSSWVPWDIVFSVEQLKLGILAGTVNIPGFSTLICNLLTTRSETEMDFVDTRGNEWLLEYTHGSGQEIYCVPLSKFFVGKSFANTVRMVHKYGQVCLFGIMTRKVQHDAFGFRRQSTQTVASLNQGDEPEYELEILINPIEYLIREGDSGYFIAAGREDVEMFSTFEVSSLPQDDQSKRNTKTKANRSMSRQQSRLTRLPSMSMQDVENEFKTVLDKPKELSIDRKPNVWRCNLPQNQRLYGWKESLAGQLSGHVVVFGKLEAFERFVHPFRESSAAPVVFLHHSDPGPLAYKLGDYQSVYFLQGSSLALSDLYRSAMDVASTAIILTQEDPTAPGRSDSTAMFTMCVIEANFKCKIVCEMMYENNMKYLTAKPDQESISTFLWPQFASGNIFPSSALDTLLCQTFYDEHLLTVILRFIQPETISAVRQNDRLASFELPPNYRGKTYSELFSDLVNLERPLIPLALYRPASWLGSTLPYLYTSPSSKAVLGEKDIVIVLGDVPYKKQGIYSNGHHASPLSARDREQLLKQSIGGGPIHTSDQHSASTPSSEHTADESQVTDESMDAESKLKSLLKQVVANMEPVEVLEQRLAAKNELINRLLNENGRLKALVNHFVPKDGR
eukprot:GILK01010530.1.p1 GENE.GILK01010530.1~~GILK01010530.1.p1  ORF type:complete len:1075 (+),score=161.66 GILK01010530.1:432-3227(+)